MNITEPVRLFGTVEEIWKETLSLPKIDRDKTFVDLGGTSLNANQMVAKLSKRLGVAVPVTKVFEFPTLRQFVRFLEGGKSSAAEEIIESASEALTSGEPEEESQAAAEASDGDVAIVGMSCRFADANTIDQFWTNLVQGKESIRFLSKEELSADVPEELRSDPRYVRARGMLDKPYGFDASFFDIGPMEAKLIDPQQRVMLETAWEALENAGYGPGSFSGRTAVYTGIEDNSYYKTEIAPFPEAEKRAGRFSIMTGNEKDFVAMRIAHKLNLNGPAVSVHTACSTSLVAVIMACKSLRSGEVDMAVAGGASVHFPTHDGYYFQEGGVFSSDGHCRPFDKGAEGTIFTDGAGVVILKRLKDAIRSRDTIYAVIKGGAINNDGHDKVSFSAPSIGGQASCIIAAQEDAGIDPRSIQYVEAHGTATPVGDPIEVEALRQAFGRKTKDRQFCGLGSVKSNLGHTTAAAGVASLIKTALALKHKQIPATLHFKNPNPDLDIENSPFYIVNRLTAWKKEKGPRRAAISSFGIGGTNSHVILEEAPELQAIEASQEAVERPFDILPVSGKTKVQRDQMLSDLARVQSDTRDIAFTLQKGRSRFKYRGARIRLNGVQADDLIAQKDGTIEDPRLIFMFPGQGSQYIEMGKSLYSRFPEFRTTFDRCAEVLSAELGVDFKSFIFDAANKETLENTRYTQPALFAIEVSIGKMLLSWGVRPDGMVGHSIGEFAAAHLSGVFSLEDGLKLIAARGRLMSSLPTGKMLSARGSLDKVREVAAAVGVDIASINSPIHSVLAGENEKIALAQAELEKAGIPCKLLYTSHAFHSNMMAPVVDPFFEIASQVKFSAPKFRIVSTVTGQPMKDSEATDPRYWAQHLRQTVCFSQAIEKTIEEGGNIFLEIGPRTTLTSLTLQHLKDKTGTAISTLADQSDEISEVGSIGTALAKLWLSGIELQWDRIWSGGSRIPLPALPLDQKNYRFSEGRQPEVRQPQYQTPANEMETTHEEVMEEIVEEAAAPSMSSEQLLVADLGKLFSEYSGLQIEANETSFVENGFDSLVLMQIGVELGKKYGISVSLRDMMGSINTLHLLGGHIAKLAKPEKLPQATQATKRTVKVARSVPARAAAQAPQQQAGWAIPQIPASRQPVSMDFVQTIHQQLSQMKQVIEMQLRYIEGVAQSGMVAQTVQAPAPAPMAQSLEAAVVPQGLVRAKHFNPPVAGAFRAPASNGQEGSEAWYRFDTEKKRYETLQ